MRIRLEIDTDRARFDEDGFPRRRVEIDSGAVAAPPPPKMTGKPDPPPRSDADTDEKLAEAWAAIEQQQQRLQERMGTYTGKPDEIEEQMRCDRMQIGGMVTVYAIMVGREPNEVAAELAEQYALPTYGGRVLQTPKPTTRPAPHAGAAREVDLDVTEPTLSPDPGLAQFESLSDEQPPESDPANADV